MRPGTNPCSVVLSCMSCRPQKKKKIYEDTASLAQGAVHGAVAQKEGGGEEIPRNDGILSLSLTPKESGAMRLCVSKCVILDHAEMQLVSKLRYGELHAPSQWPPGNTFANNPNAQIPTMT